MTRLLLVRHGETEWCSQKRHKGQTDIPLNEVGRQQAQAAAKRLQSEDVAVVYASDLSRTMETARIIAEPHNLDIVAESRLREMQFGEWEGLTYEEIYAQNQITPDEWHHTMLESGPPGGESLRQFAARIQSFLDEIETKHTDETVLLVTHGGTLMVMICLLLEHPIKKYWQFRLERTSVSEISTYPEGAIVTLLNDTHHLA